MPMTIDTTTTAKRGKVIVSGASLTSERDCGREPKKILLIGQSVYTIVNRVAINPRIATAM